MKPHAPRTNITTRINTRCRLLCPDCRELKKVKSVGFDEAGVTVARLECQHSRGELLPVTAPGRVSLELLNTVAGRLMFPVASERVVTGVNP
jgi:hypothetical protein